MKATYAFVSGGGIQQFVLAGKMLDSYRPASTGTREGFFPRGLPPVVAVHDGFFSNNGSETERYFLSSATARLFVFKREFFMVCCFTMVEELSGIQQNSKSYNQLSNETLSRIFRWL